jgi:RND family efflux transporter MFP subunit
MKPAAAIFSLVLSALLVVPATAGSQLDAGGDLEGFFEPYEVVKIAAQAPGILDEVAVKRGDFVKKGQVIARFKSGVERATVEYFRAKAEFGSRKSARNEELARKQLISANEKDELDTDIQLSRLQLQEAGEKLRMRTIVSPIDGVVTRKSHNAGEYVGEDDIVTVAKIDPLNVEVIVPAARFGMIAKGQSADVRPDHPVGGAYRATVVIVDRIIDAASGTFGVRLELPNSDLKLPAGLKCKVKFLP